MSVNHRAKVCFRNDSIDKESNVNVSVRATRMMLNDTSVFPVVHVGTVRSERPMKRGAHMIGE